MRVLIIGGTGLISSATVPLLVDRGDEVTLVNRHGTSPIPGARAIIGDRGDAGFEAQLAALPTFDVIVDMVGYEPADGEQLARLGSRCGQVVFCSTVDVYPKPAAGFYPVRPDDPLGADPAFQYAWKKVRIEEHLWCAHREGRLALTVLRPGHTYGEGRGLVHPFGGGIDCLRRIRAGLPLIVHGDGSSLWSACHRDDVARAFAGAIGNPAALGRAYNVTGDQCMTWNQYWLLAAQALGCPCPELVHIPTQLLYRLDPERAAWILWNFMHDNVFDNGSAKRDLGFAQTIGWVQGVGRVAQWLRDHGVTEDPAQFAYYDQAIARWRAAEKTFLS